MTYENIFSPFSFVYEYMTKRKPNLWEKGLHKGKLNLSYHVTVKLQRIACFFSLCMPFFVNILWIFFGGTCTPMYRENGMDRTREKRYHLLELLYGSDIPTQNNCIVTKTCISVLWVAFYKNAFYSCLNAAGIHTRIMNDTYLVKLCTLW